MYSGNMTSNEALNLDRTFSNLSKASFCFHTIAKFLLVLSELNEWSETSASLNSDCNLLLGTSYHNIDRFILV